MSSTAAVKRKNMKHYSVGSIIWIIVEYASLIFFGFCAIIPIVSCITTAFKTDAEYQNTNVMAFPGSWLNFDNFVNAFKTANMGRAFLNSVIVMVVVLTVSVIVGSQLAYVLNRFKFPGNGFIRNLYTIAALLPAVAMQVTVYQIMSDYVRFTSCKQSGRLHHYELWYRCYFHVYFHSVYGKYSAFTG